LMCQRSLACGREGLRQRVSNCLDAALNVWRELSLGDSRWRRCSDDGQALHAGTACATREAVTHAGVEGCAGARFVSLHTPQRSCNESVRRNVQPRQTWPCHKAFGAMRLRRPARRQSTGSGADSLPIVPSGGRSRGRDGQGGDGRANAAWREREFADMQSGKATWILLDVCGSVGWNEQCHSRLAHAKKTSSTMTHGWIR
jgi:hypothetical protein